MIKSFKSRALRDYWLKDESKGIKPEWIDRVHNLLSALDAADTPQDLAPLGYGFHSLKGKKKSIRIYALTIRANWRIVFEWENGAVRVDMEDYHRGHHR
jgi:proteic killer suppression protein